MKKFKVRVHRTTVEFATITVEAENVAEAEDQAIERAMRPEEFEGEVPAWAEDDQQIDVSHTVEEE